MKKGKNELGITLIVLTITIIVLLILAGVTIAALTGDNGILTRASDAREQTQRATAEEKVAVEVAGSYGTDGEIDPDLLNRNLENVEGLETALPVSLPAMVVVDGYEIMIGANGSVGTVTRIPVEKETTKPYLPGNDFTVVESSLDNGLVVTDGTNYWTWIEVPTDIYENTTYNGGMQPAGENDYDAIETTLNNYTGTLVDRKGYADVWYDRYGVVYNNEESEYSQISLAYPYEDGFNDAKELYGAIYTDENGQNEATSYTSGTTYYVKITDNLNDAEGCGLTYEEYNNLKKYMLSSVYQNGGFWIGQYEAGADSYPATDVNDTRKLIVQEGAFPYNYITCSNAQIKSSGINSGNYTSSLMFGIQWDLVLKHLETNGEWDESNTPQYYLTEDGRDWGNYYDIGFDINKGGYTESPSTANSFTLLLENETYSKSANSRVLLTTGATERNSKMNIYDLGGNVYEFTLENSPYSYFPCSTRGAGYNTYGSGYVRAASIREFYRTIDSGSNAGFRPALY